MKKDIHNNFKSLIKSICLECELFQKKDFFIERGLIVYKKICNFNKLKDTCNLISDKIVIFEDENKIEIVHLNFYNFNEIVDIATKILEDA